MSTTTAVKLCIHCRHFLPYESADEAMRVELARCAASASVESLVDGKLHPTRRYCDNERMAHGDCGPGGKKFEEAPF
jgi:hypothetical protein